MPDPNCSKCNQPLTWVPQYSKWYCTKCASYTEAPAIPQPAPQPPSQPSPAQASPAVPPPPPGYYPPPSPTPPPDPNCPTCNKALTYIFQYRQWYCNTCQKYHPQFPPPFLCRKCQRPAQFVAAYNQYYCPYCMRYYKVNANAIESFLDTL